MLYNDLIIKPVITEKSTIQKENDNTVTFEVAKTANRIEVKKAIEALFNVKVDSVRTINITGKIKRRGRVLGKRRDWKKAIVTLSPGERIEFFDGV